MVVCQQQTRFDRRKVGKSMSSYRRVTCGVVLCIIAVLVLATPLQATTTLQPIGASTSMLSAPASDINSTRDQSGLSAGYVGGTTFFGPYLAGNPTHESLIGGFKWQAQLDFSGTIDFDLEGLNSISSMALWNGNDGIDNFDLLIDDNPGFTSPELVGIFSASNPPDPSLTAADVYSFAPTIGSHVRLQVFGSHGSEASLGEVLFERYAPTVQPVGATTNMGASASSIIDNTHDQSGLTAGYVSGSTTLGELLAGEPTHESFIGGFKWVANTGIAMGVIDYDLGSEMFIDAMALWNGSDGISNFDLLIDDNPSFTSPDFVGNFSPSFAADPSLTAADVFSFAPAKGSHVRMFVWGSYGSEASLGEVVFQQFIPAPEPSTLALTALALLVLLVHGRRRRRA